MTLPKLYVLNEKTKRYVAADGAIGRKIVNDKHDKKERLIYFNDNKGKVKYSGSPVPVSRSRCPKGTRRDPKTKECVTAKPKTKRCPKGTRRDPKTKECIPRQQILKKKKSSTKMNLPITPVGQEIPKSISKQSAQSEAMETTRHDVQEKQTLEKMYKENKISLRDLEKSWSILNVPPDHFCGYHALSVFLRMRGSDFVGQDETANITKLINSLRQKYRQTRPTDNLTEADIKTRLRELSDDNIQSKWMSDDDMVIFSKMFNICFAVLREDPTMNMLHWQIIRHDVPSTLYNFEEVFKQCMRTQNIIYLYNPDFPGLHYDLLLPNINETFPIFDNYLIDHSGSNPLFAKSFSMIREVHEAPPQKSKSISPTDSTKEYILELTPQYQSTDYSSAQNTPQTPAKPISPPVRKKTPVKVNAPPMSSFPRKQSKKPFVLHSNDQLVKMIDSCFKKS